jgi:hypothetical protein
MSHTCRHIPEAAQTKRPIAETASDIRPASGCQTVLSDIQDG